MNAKSYLIEFNVIGEMFNFACFMMKKLNDCLFKLTVIFLTTLLYS